VVNNGREGVAVSGDDELQDIFSSSRQSAAKRLNFFRRSDNEVTAGGFKSKVVTGLALHANDAMNESIG